MTVSQLRRQLKKRIDSLSSARLKSAADYLAYLDETSHPVAVAMHNRIRKSEDEVARGALTSVSNLRRK